MQAPHRLLILFISASALGACDIIGGAKSFSDDGYKIVADRSSRDAVEPTVDPAYDDYVCRRDGVTLPVAAERCGAEGGVIALAGQDDPIRWQTALWNTPSVAGARGEDLARARALNDRPSVASLPAPSPSPTAAPMPRARPLETPSGLIAPPRGEVGGHPEYAHASRAAPRAENEPYLAFDPCRFEILAGPGCPGYRR